MVVEVVTASTASEVVVVTGAMSTVEVIVLVDVPTFSVVEELVTTASGRSDVVLDASGVPAATVVVVLVGRASTLSVVVVVEAPTIEVVVVVWASRVVVSTMDEEVVPSAASVVLELEVIKSEVDELVAITSASVVVELLTIGSFTARVVVVVTAAVVVTAPSEDVLAEVATTEVVPVKEKLEEVPSKTGEKTDLDVVVVTGDGPLTTGEVPAGVVVPDMVLELVDVPAAGTTAVVDEVDEPTTGVLVDDTDGPWTVVEVAGVLVELGPAPVELVTPVVELLRLGVVLTEAVVEILVVG